MASTLQTKLYSGVVALSVGLSGCYGSQGGVLRDQDFVLQRRLFDTDSHTEFQNGFKSFYHADSLEQKLFSSKMIGSGPCPPYLPNCGKKKDEKKNNDEDEVFRENLPSRSSPSVPSSESSPVSSEKSHASDWLMIVGGGLGLYTGYRYAAVSNTCSKHNLECGKGLATGFGYVLITGGVGLVLLGISRLVKK